MYSQVAKQSPTMKSASISEENRCVRTHARAPKKIKPAIVDSNVCRRGDANFVASERRPARTPASQIRKYKLICGPTNQNRITARPAYRKRLRTPGQEAAARTSAGNKT